MTAREMQLKFDADIQLAGKEYEIEEKPDSFTIFYFLNQAQERLVKTRYSGLNAKGESFEQTQKRTDDLRTLVVESNITPVVGTIKPNSYVATLPTDYFLAVGEEATISYTNPLTGDVETNRGGITDCTSDTYSRQVNDPYSEHVLHYESALPLRLFRDDSVELITDGNYTVTNYYVRYLKMPLEIGLPSNNCELPEHMHSEVVTKAVSLFLEANSNPRYNTSIKEVGQIE